MGNSNSASVELHHPPGWQPSTYPRENVKRGKHKANINGLSPENKVLPELVAGARLRQTRLGAILQSGGTITGRKKESSKKTPAAQKIGRSSTPQLHSQVPYGHSTAQQNVPYNPPLPQQNIPLRQNTPVPFGYPMFQPARRRLSNVFEVAERDRDREHPRTFVKKFDSEPDLRESETPSYDPSPLHKVISEPPTKTKIKARKNKRAPAPPKNEQRAKSLPRDIYQRQESQERKGKENEPYSLPDLSKSIVKVQHWQDKQVNATEEQPKKGAFRKFRLFKTKSDGKKVKSEEGSDLSSRKSAPPGAYEWDLHRRVHSQDRQHHPDARYYWTPERVVVRERAKSLDCIQAQLQAKSKEKDRMQQGKSLECITQRPRSRSRNELVSSNSLCSRKSGSNYDTTLDSGIQTRKDSKRHMREVKRGKDGNHSRLDETLSSGGSSGRRSSRLDAYKQPVFVSASSKAQISVTKSQVEIPEYSEPIKVTRQHSQHQKSVAPPDFANEIKAAVQRRLSQRLSGESTGLNEISKERNEVYRSSSKAEKQTPKQFFFGMDEESKLRSNNANRTSAQLLINGDSVEYRRSSDKNNRDRSASRDSYIEENKRNRSRSRERLESDGNKSSSHGVTDVRIHKNSRPTSHRSSTSLENSPPRDRRKLSREVERFASVIQQKQKQLEQKAATERDELISVNKHESQEETSSNPVGSTSSSDGEIGVIMHLRPTLPRKQMEIPRFSPSAAWRSINYGSSDSPINSNHSSEEQGDIFEDRIRLSSRPVAPRRISNEKSGDSGISGDAGSPGPLQDFDITTSEKMKRSELSMRPLAVSSPVPPISANSSLVKSKHWTPEQDLEEESMEEESVENSPVSSPERFTSGVTTPPKLTSRTNMFTGYSKTYPINGSQEYLENDYTDSIYENRKSKPRAKRKKTGEEPPTPNTFNSLRKLKRTMSNALASKRGKSPDERHSLDENWSLSRSVPSSLNKPEETEVPVRPRTWSVDKLRDSPKHEIEQRNPTISITQLRPAGFNRMFGGRPPSRHIMYLPEYNSVKPDASEEKYFGETGDEGIPIKNAEAIYCNVNPGDLYRAWEPIQQSKPLQTDNKKINEPLKKKGKRFTFNSTVRQQERKRLEQQLNREAEEKERQRKKEMELMQKVEEEFQLKRNREKANIRQQLRLMQIQNKEPEFPKSPKQSPRYSDDSSRQINSTTSDFSFNSELIKSDSSPQHSLQTAEVEARKQYANISQTPPRQEYANIEAIRRHHRPGYLITRKPSTKNPNSDNPPPPPTSPPPPVTPEEYLPVPAQFGRPGSSSSHPDLDSSDTTGTPRLDSSRYHKENTGVFSGISRWVKGKAKGSPKSNSPTESRSLSPTRQEPDGAAEPDQKKGEVFRREIINASKTRKGETSSIDSSQVERVSPERKKSIYKHLSEVAEKEERIKQSSHSTGDKEKSRSSKATHIVPLTQELSEYKEERREYREYLEYRGRERIQKHSDTSSDGVPSKQTNGPSGSCARSSDNYRLGFAIGSSQGSSVHSHPSDSDPQDRKEGWSGSSDPSTPQIPTNMRFGMGGVQPFNPKPGYRPVAFTPKAAPVS